MSLPAPKPQSVPVLLIEDEPGVMAYVQAALERSGYPVVCCESGADALRLLENGSFLGVISDMRTPGGVDGGHVHAWICRNRPDLASRIIFITGDIANEETVATLRQTGAPCLEKPFRVAPFIEVVSKTFGKAE
ncbi:MAG TPA: response regulator [Candidatus Sulfotelmatobacter sp.]|nr:response regulator [Candidatus Sulfotelmatobacter sp.]